MEKIDHNSLRIHTGIKADKEFECDYFGMSNTLNPGSISFIDNENFLDQLNNNENITVVICNEELGLKIRNKTIAVCEDPRYYFYVYLNKIGELNYTTFPSRIHPSAKIHPKAFVSEVNVVIGENTIVHPNATILADVEIGDDCIIDPAAVIGATGYEYKKTSKGILPVFHDGKVVIKNKVEVGAGTTIDKGFSFRNTVIDDETKIDNNVYVAHASHVGKRVFIVGNAMLSGSVTVGDDVWIGPSVTLPNGIKVGNHAILTIGSVVTKDVAANERVTGNFAVPHTVFMKNLKKKFES